MPSIEKYIEIRDTYTKVKETIMVSAQQSLLGYFISPAGLYNFLKQKQQRKSTK